MRDVDLNKLHRLEQANRELGKIIGDELDEQMGGHYGFTLFMFSFDGPEFTYISNAERGPMVQALKEWIARVESNTDDELGRKQRWEGRQN